MLATPNTCRRYVGTMVASFTLTAFAGLPPTQVVPAGSSELRQSVDTVVVTVLRFEAEFRSPLEPLYASASVVAFTDSDCDTYTCPAAASAAALASFCS